MASPASLEEDNSKVRDISPKRKSPKKSLKLRRNTNSDEDSEDNTELLIELKSQSEAIKGQLSQLREAARDKSLTEIVSNEDKLLQLGVDSLNFKMRRTLRGHLSKVLRVKWIGESNDLLSISPDGRVLYWDTVSGMKKKLMQLPSMWSTCCACSSNGRLLASGGLDNMCTIRSLKHMQQCLSLAGHKAYISQCMFLSNDERVLTSSGDRTIILWDVSTTQPIHTFESHQGDVLDICLSRDERCLLSVSIDKTCRVWDVTNRTCTRICEGHDGDVNCVAFFPSNDAFATGSDDQTCKLFDLRSDQYIATYTRRVPGKSSGITSVDFSKSGRLLIAGCEDSKCSMWDTLNPDKLMGTLHHPNRVSSVSVNHNGEAIATGCWDCNIRIWN